MKSLSLIGAAALSLCVSPLASASACDKASVETSTRPVHKVLALFHSDHEVDPSVRTGAFLELTGAAP